MYAFPSGHNPKTGTQESGMTLRDYFAVKAMQGKIANSGSWFTASPVHEKTLLHDAQFCYEIADAMLKARDE